MDNQVFIGQQSHQRVSFAPLTSTCHIRCITPQSMLTQSHNSVNGEYEPNRQVNPTVLVPEIRVYDPSKVFPAGGANSRLSLDSIKWYVDDVDVTTVWTAKSGGSPNDYEIITTEDDMRGSIKVYRNIPSTERHTLRFKGKFYDYRTGATYSVESDIVSLSTTEKGDNQVACFVDKSEIVYDPFYDPLLKAEYLYGIGSAASVPSSAKTDPKSYLQTVNIQLTVGTTLCESLPNTLAMRLVQLGNTTPITTGLSFPEVVSIGWNKVVFDCRLIEKGNYEVQFLNRSTGKVLARQPISIVRKTSMPTTASYLHNADITPSFKVFHDTVMMNVGKQMADYPQLWWLIQWKTLSRIFDSKTGLYYDGTEKLWQIGEKLAVNVADLEIGLTVNDSFFLKWVEVSPHPVCELTQDDAGLQLYDDDGVTPLID